MKAFRINSSQIMSNADRKDLKDEKNFEKDIGLIGASSCNAYFWNRLTQNPTDYDIK